MHKKTILKLWDDISNQKWDKISSYFHKEASIFWNNTNEKFDVENFIKVNSYYPGNWKITVQRIEQIDNLVITVALVMLEDSKESHYATSFFVFENDLIIELNEYWGENGEPPKWRQELLQQNC